MKTITLKELCQKTGVSRRAIQGYEEFEIVHALGFTKMGHLVYDEEEIGHVEKVRLYQKAGFSLKEIKQMEQMKKAELIAMLSTRLYELQENAFRLEQHIQKILEEVDSKEN